ncbi:MurR/RpiR family transcriptional regulator [Sporolactobacillus laevolacticus]|uniref:RpiR family transcriptional regulator n=1 Tax=Sporolactobacillus laevolacticus DSM 442 TaxID=1395513 RepID=V6IX41_9BACL|nr:MurR/RpiR family transcriptional regulator [Sporolactobacillus laevolacticus]EST11171.1 RpiR family transcriptional regulator [Sporolactobacillus laevolacticus DSM 442]
MESNTKEFVNRIYSSLGKFSKSEKKIVDLMINDPQFVINATISQLANRADVSEASISRFCKRIDLDGFHHLKVILAQSSLVNVESQNSNFLNSDDKTLDKLMNDKTDEIQATLEGLDTTQIKEIIQVIKDARLLQIMAEGNTFPVALDACFKFNQIGRLAFTASSWEVAMGQALNLTDSDVVIVISNSGESRQLIQLIDVAKKNHVKVIALTNNNSSPIAALSDYNMVTASRGTIFMSEYFFSRVSAVTAIEAIFMLLIADNPQLKKKIQKHELLISSKKI